jgi:hypothetical protein
LFSIKPSNNTSHAASPSIRTYTLSHSHNYRVIKYSKLQLTALSENNHTLGQGLRFLVTYQGPILIVYRKNSGVDAGMAGNDATTKQNNEY